MSKAEQAKKRYLRLKAAGLCTCCGHEKTRPGKVICEKCADRRHTVWKENYEYCVKHGFCTSCHIKLSEYEIEDGLHTCAECRGYGRIFNQKQREKQRRQKLERENQCSFG